MKGRMGGQAREGGAGPWTYETHGTYGSHISPIGPIVPLCAQPAPVAALRATAPRTPLLAPGSWLLAPLSCPDDGKK